MLELTPGVHFLITGIIPTLLGPPCFIHALFVAFPYLRPINRTFSLLACIYMLIPPVYLFIKLRVSRLNMSLAARRLRARVVPHVDGLLPGNIDLIFQILTSDKTDYIGEPWLAFMKGRGKTFAIEILGDRRICTMNPKNIQKVLATDFDNYCKGPQFNDMMKSMLGVGVFNSDGDMWQFHRKMTRPFFSKERVMDLRRCERKVAAAIQKMQDRLDAGMAVDFQDLVSRFTLDYAAELLLGTSINSIDAPLALPYNSPSVDNCITSTASTRFARAFSAAQVILLERAELGRLWPLGEIFYDKMKEPMAEIRSFIDPIVRNAIAKRERADTEEENTLLEHMIGVTDDMKVIVDETLNIMLAARDTTASLLTFVTYCLATHPDVFSRLRDEILNAIGRNRSPSYEELRDMRHLRAVINETLRLFPPVPFNMRETVNETTWLDDQGGKLYLPAHTRVAFNLFHLQRSEEYWGADAHIFDPDRWLDTRIRHYTSNPFIFVPFNGGPRTCLGQQFAYYETSFFLVRLLQHFSHVELAPECQPPKTRPPAEWKDPVIDSSLAKRKAIEQCFLRSHLTLYADGGLWIRAKKSEALQGV